MGKNLVKETKSELKKVIWPSATQVRNSTAVVIAMVIIVGVIIFAFDFISSGAIKWTVERDYSSLSAQNTENVNVPETNVVPENTPVTDTPDENTPVVSVPDENTGITE